MHLVNPLYHILRSLLNWYLVTAKFCRSDFVAASLCYLLSGIIILANLQTLMRQYKLNSVGSRHVTLLYFLIITDQELFLIMYFSKRLEPIPSALLFGNLR